MSSSPRLGVLVGFAIAVVGRAGGDARAEPPASGPAVVLFADRDDDDADGVPDGEQEIVPASPDLRALASIAAPPSGDARARGAKALPSTSGRVRVGDPSLVRIVVDGKPSAPGKLIPAKARRVELEGLRAGRTDVEVQGHAIRVGVVEVRAIDGQDREVDFARSHASLQRTPPDRLADDPYAKSDDPDALRIVVVGHADDLPPTLRIMSVSAAGAPVDTLADIALGDVRCPAGVAAGLTCGSTRPIRSVADDIDRNHPMTLDRSIKAELGGALIVQTPHGDKMQQIRVGGPRTTEIGAIVRYRAALRILMVRVRPHGMPPMGGDVVGAVRVAQDEVRRANALWGACGISFGRPEDVDVQIVDPPRPHLLALGCDHGLVASGGAVRVRIDGHDVAFKVTAGTQPAAAARVGAAAVAAAGFSVVVSDNEPIFAGAFGSSDLLVRRRDGALAQIERPTNGPVSTDPTLTACIGDVDLEDGLQHFGDVDAIAGTVEERSLIKAFDDGDPRTIEVFMLPSFGGGGRIGESFISADGGAIRNVVLEDRAGIRADRASFALAHELGHVLLDDPGHPDDFGADTPTRLMDADAANASAYGPRRLLVSECVRAVRQSGPLAPVALLAPWPLAPIGREREAPRAVASTRAMPAPPSGAASPSTR